MNTVIGDLFVRLGVDLTAFHADLGSAEKRIERFGTQMFFLGSRITAGVSIPMTAALGIVGKFGMDFDKAMTESLAIMDQVGLKVRSEMEGVAKSLTDITKFSATEGAEGFYHLASAGLDAATMMGALPVVARFAQAGVMDLAKATEFLAGAQAAMSNGTESAAVKVEQMARVADVLTLANNRALGTIQDFAEALTNKAGAALRQTHKDVEEGVAVLAAYASQNIKGKTAGQQLWMVIRDLGTYALKNADAFKKHNIAVFDATGAMRNMADIIRDVEQATAKMSDAQRAAMFIELGLPLRSVAATKALIGYSEAIREHEIALRNAGGTTQEVADKQMQALSNQLIQLKNQFAAAAIDIFKSFIPTFKDYVLPLMKEGIDLFKSFGRWVGSLPEPVKALALAGAGLLIVIGPLVAAIGSFTLLGSAAMRGLSALAGVFGTTATAAGLAAGGTNWLTITTAELQAQQTTAALAAIAQARAMGMTAFQANALGASTMAAVRAQQQLNIAQAQSPVGISLMGKAWGALASPVGITVGLILSGVAALRYMSGELGENGKQLTLYEAASTTVTGTLSKLGDVLYVVGEGWKDLFTLLKEYGSDAWNFAVNKEHELTKSHFSLLEALSYLSPFKGLETELKELGKQSHHTGGMFGYLQEKWEQFILGIEMRHFNPAAEAARMNKAILAKGAPPLFRGETPQIKVESWMMASNPYEVRARLDAKAAEQGGMPNLEPPTVPKISEAQKMFEKLSGKELQEDIKATTEAFNKLIAAGKHLDPSVHERMWQAYKNLRGETDALVGPFEHLFRQEIDDYNLKIQLAQATENWGNVMSDAADKMIGDIDNVQVALFKMNDAQKGAFFTKHEGTIKELMPLYDSLEPKVQMLIIAYQRWKIAAGDGGEFRKGAAAAMTAMDDMLAKSEARLEDAQTELLRSTQSAGDAHRNTLKSNLAKIEADQDKAYRQALTKMALYEGKELDEYIKKLNAMRTADAEYRRVYEANESYKFAASMGVNSKLLRAWATMSQKQRDEIIKTREEWLRLMRDMHGMVDATSALGQVFSSLGGSFADFGSMLEGVGKSSATFLQGMEQWDKAEGIGQHLNALVTMAQGVVQAFQNMQQQGTRSMRALSGAMSGAQIGTMIMPGWGTLIGAGIGALAGAMMGDPGWKQVQQTAARMWHEKVSKELANQIDKDSDMLGGHVNATLLHLSDIAAEAGGITSQNVGRWADRLANTFSILGAGEMTTAQATKILDANFQNLVESGTMTNGIVADQIIQLVRLEKQYKTGSKAVKEFVDAQLGIAVSGFNNIVKGTAGFMMDLLGQAEDADTALERRNGLHQKEAKLQAQIADYEKEGVKNEKQRVALAIARIELARTQMEIKREEGKQASADAALQQLSGPSGQETFDRLSRLGMVTFDALVASGRPLTQILDEMGTSLDTLTAAQDAFGFTTSEAFQELMKFREFATVHPELIAELDGLNQMMQGLTNTGYMTEQTFNDLGNEADSVFGRMVAGGLTSDQALRMMQPTLQTLWQLQHQYGFKVDETTGKILEQAAAAGIVGPQFMSATDKMVAGIDKLIARFDLLLKKWGIDIPQDAQEAAQSVEDAFSGVHPDIEVGWHYKQYGEDIPEPPEPRPLAEGGVITRPILAGEAGPEAIIPLDRLFSELRLRNEDESPVVVNHYYSVTINTIDGPSTERFVNSPEFGTAFRRATQTNINDVRSTIRETVK